MDSKDVTIERLKYELSIEREARIKLLSKIDYLQKTLNHKSWRVNLPPVDSNLPHGHSRYSKGCRCDICRDAAAEYQKYYRELQKERNKMPTDPR